MTRRLAILSPALLAAGIGWANLREPGRWYGLAAAELAAVTTWPLLLLALVFGAPAVLALAVPRSWRVWYRRRHPGEGRHIPARLRRAVCSADRWRCVGCRWEGYEIDHIRPWACGGLTSLWNLALLCTRCNKVKSNYWRYPSGSVTYRPWSGYDDQAEAALILAAERRARRNPARWLRAALAL
jgi:hypothetical protein